MSDAELKQWLIDNFPDEAEDILIADGLSDAFVGVTDCEPRRCVYSIPQIIELLIEEDMTEEDAHEHLSYNILGAYVGEHTPVFIHTP
jgi:hypothetical protein